MKKETLIQTAILPGLVGAAAIILTVIPFSVESVAGFLTAVLLAVIAALDYRISWKLLQRSLARVGNLVLDGIRHIPAVRVADGTV